MMRFHSNNRSRGLTLLELVIVLTILVAVAGVAVAMFPRLLTRAHVASCSANIPELFKAIQMYDSVSLDGYPDRVDTMIVNDAIATYVPEGVRDELDMSALTDEEAEALIDAGIREVTVMVNDPGRPTFWPYAEPDVQYAEVVDGMNVAFLQPAVAQRLGLTSDGEERFVVFGLGTPCRMFGRTMNEAPAHFSDATDGNPNQQYMRYVAVYQVGGRTNTGTVEEPVYEYDTFPRARLRGVLAIHPSGFEGLAGHVEEYWEEVEMETTQQ